MKTIMILDATCALVQDYPFHYKNNAHHSGGTFCLYLTYGEQPASLGSLTMKLPKHTAYKMEEGKKYQVVIREIEEGDE